MVTTPQIILIDGPAGSGKTTLALELKSQLRCQVIHLDSLYNGWDDALGESLTSTLVELVTTFASGNSYKLPIFNWEKMEFDSVEIIEPADSIIIEGVGAGQSAIRSYASKLYWVEAPSEIGLQRVLARDGEGIATQMRRWQVSEAKHFSDERTREFANFIISTA